MLHHRIKVLTAITITLAAALSISSCTAENNSGFVTESKYSNASQDQNTSILIQTAGNNSDGYTSDALHQTNQADQTAFPLSVTSWSQNLPGEFGAAGAAADQELNLEDMLTYSIEDEYLAYGEYQYVLELFGIQRPFSNIIKAEETHISLLQPLFEQYNIPVPADQSSKYLITPASITEAFQTGVQAEIDNIAMYDKFLQQDLPDDVRLVFEDLRNASLNHLDAFQKTRG